MRGLDFALWNREGSAGRHAGWRCYFGIRTRRSRYSPRLGRLCKRDAWGAIAGEENTFEAFSIDRFGWDISCKRRRGSSGMFRSSVPIR